MYSNLITIFFIIATFTASSTKAQSIRGLWYWTWSQSVNSGSTNLGIAFSGWTDPEPALRDSANVVGKLQGQKFISLGGGNANGRWNAALLRKIASFCSATRFKGYNGVAFDIEEGDAGLASTFVSTFKTCKSKGYKILVTISHSTPYGIPDGAAMMNTFFREAGSIDYMSPQLYTTGSEGANDFATNGVAWSGYRAFSGKFVPSIVSGNMYNAAKTYFDKLGINSVGFIQWSQTATVPGPKPPTTPGPKGSTTRCGANWGAANSACGGSCKTDADCRGSKCFADLSLAPCGARAIAGNSNTFSEQYTHETEYSRLAIGLLISQSILLVLVIGVVVMVVLMFKRKVSERV